MGLVLKTSCLVIVATALTGCFSGSGNGAPGPEPSVDFTSFVKIQIDNTSDTREAVQINKRDFSFNDQTNEQAFDELFIQ